MDESRRCTAKSKQSGERCKRAAIVGGTVCAMHGGKVPRVQAAAKRRVDQEAAEFQVQALGLKPREISYQDALLEELWRTAGYVDLLERKVEQEGEEGLTQWGMTGRSPSALWSMLEDQRKHMVVVASACGKAGIEERRVQLAEQQGKLLAQVVAQIVTGLGHDLHDEAVQGVVRPALQLVRSAA